MVKIPTRQDKRWKKVPENRVTAYLTFSLGLQGQKGDELSLLCRNHWVGQSKLSPLNLYAHYSGMKTSSEVQKAAVAGHLSLYMMDPETIFLFMIDWVLSGINLIGM